MKRTTSFELRSAETVKAVSHWTPREWAKWLRSVFRHGDTYPLSLAPNADPLNELEEIYAQSHEDARTAIKDGIVKAIHDWDLRYHGYAMLRWLSFAAARLRASDVIPDLVDILVRNREQLRYGKGEFFDVADDLLAVMAGFAPDPVIEKVFLALLFDDHISPRLTGLLALGVSMSDRRKFAKAFNRFVERKKLAPGFFDDEEIVRAYAQFMSPRGLVNEARSLQAAGQDYVYTIAGKLDLVDPEVMVGWDGGDAETARHGDVAEFDQRNQAHHLGVRYHAARLGIERRIRDRQQAAKTRRRKPLPESFGQLALNDIYQRAAAIGAGGEA
jgi:hypothetical protein